MSLLFYYYSFCQYFLAKQVELYKQHITSTHVGLWSQGKTKASKNITKTWTHIHKYSFIIFVILSYITCRRARGESYSRGCFCKFLFFFFFITAMMICRPHQLCSCSWHCYYDSHSLTGDFLYRCATLLLTALSDNVTVSCIKCFTVRLFCVRCLTGS